MFDKVLVRPGTRHSFLTPLTHSRRCPRPSRFSRRTSPPTTDSNHVRSLRTRKVPFAITLNTFTNFFDQQLTPWNCCNRQNNSRLDELSSKVHALRGVTVDIYDHARSQDVIDNSVRQTLSPLCIHPSIPYLPAYTFPPVPVFT